MALRSTWIICLNLVKELDETGKIRIENIAPFTSFDSLNSQHTSYKLAFESEMLQTCNLSTTDIEKRKKSSEEMTKFHLKERKNQLIFFY